METIFEAVRSAALRIDTLIREGELGYSDHANATGDTQLKLDIASDAIIEETFRDLAAVAALISEEKDDPMPLSTTGRYTVCYDPLDGSSIVDSNLSVGSIFGIYDGEPRGETIVAAAYVIYGPRIELVTALPDRPPRRYRYVRSRWEELDPLRLQSRGKLNASGATQKNWLPHHKAFIESLFARGYRLRYSGGMAPDLHQILVKGGGIFSYPGTTDKPEGKLRQLFEVIPYALIYEAAGGAAVDDRGRRLLDLVPRHIHDTTPCFFGSREEIADLKSAYGVA
jgi:fructose-1,6-bisphosphatase I